MKDTVKLLRQRRTRLARWLTELLRQWWYAQPEHKLPNVDSLPMARLQSHVDKVQTALQTRLGAERVRQAGNEALAEELERLAEEVFYDTGLAD